MIISCIIFVNFRRYFDMFLGLDFFVDGEDLKYCFCLKLKFNLMNGFWCLDCLILYEGLVVVGDEVLSFVYFFKNSLFFCCGFGRVF